MSRSPVAAANAQGPQMARDNEEALWVSCPKCDARPGDGCVFDSLDTEAIDCTSFRLHHDRVDMMNLLATMEDDE